MKLSSEFVLLPKNVGKISEPPYHCTWFWQSSLGMVLWMFFWRIPLLFCTVSCKFEIHMITSTSFITHMLNESVTGRFKETDRLPSSWSPSERQCSCASSPKLIGQLAELTPPSSGWVGWGRGPGGQGHLHWFRLTVASGQSSTWDATTGRDATPGRPFDGHHFIRFHNIFSIQKLLHHVKMQRCCMQSFAKFRDVHINLLENCPCLFLGNL